MCTRYRFEFLLVVMLLVGGAWPASAQAPAAAPAATIVASTFDTNADGWTVAGDAITPIYHPTGGNPGGYLLSTDLVGGDTWYWQAPAKFLGHKSAVYGGVLRFDLRQDQTDVQFEDADVVLVGGGIAVVHKTTYHPDLTWTHYAVILHEHGNWYKDALGGGQPSAAEMRTVLANLTELRIRGEFRSGDDSGDLDNVFLGSPTGAPWDEVPGPTAIFLAGRTDVSIPPLGSDPETVGFPLTRNCVAPPCEDYLLEVFPQAYPAKAGTRFAFWATGAVNYYGNTYADAGPDGIFSTESEIEALAGISGYQGPNGALVGVFLDNANPAGSSAPEILDFRSGGLGTAFATLSPQLRQVFFIGDGLTGTGNGTRQVFVAPAGATRVFIGIADAGGFYGPPGAYDDNYGFFWVQVGPLRTHLPLTIRKH